LYGVFPVKRLFFGFCSQFFVRGGKGTDMLFEQIPAYLEFFSYGTTTPEELRAVAEVSY
jgi:hypothetical protein